MGISAVLSMKAFCFLNYYFDSCYKTWCCQPGIVCDSTRGEVGYAAILYNLSLMIFGLFHIIDPLELQNLMEHIDNKHSCQNE